MVGHTHRSKSIDASDISSGEVKEPTVRFEPTRLPWHDAIGQRFGDIGVSRKAWNVLCEAIFPNAKTVDSIVLALSYCAARKLDPFKRPVHIVPMWDSKQKNGQGGYVDTVWPSIAELRTTAFRTGQYAGCEETVFGPLVTKTFEGSIKRAERWEKCKVEVTFPQWAQITVKRLLAGTVVTFCGPKVYWLETYARMLPSDIPNVMWQRRPHGQIEKCAEAAALRKAFPEEIGNDYSAEEMEGQKLLLDVRGESARINDVPAPLAPPRLTGGAQERGKERALVASPVANQTKNEMAENQVLVPDKVSDIQKVKQTTMQAQSRSGVEQRRQPFIVVPDPFDEDRYVDAFCAACAACENIDELGLVWGQHEAFEEKLATSHRESCVSAYFENEKRLQD